MSQNEFNPKDKSKVTLAYFSQAMIALKQECLNHPVLLAQLEELGPNADWADQLAEIAAYCNVIMDGLYSQEDLEILYPQLTRRMVDTRLSASSGIIINPSSQTQTKH